jgi:hypothetical protein
MSATRSPESVRHRSPSEWQAILQRFATSGLSGPQFCKAQHIAYPTLYQWRQRLGASMPSPSALAALPSAKPALPFVELNQADFGTEPQWHITLKLGNGVELCLRQG